MKLTDEQIAKFQELYKKHFGEDISKEEALKLATKFVQLIKIIIK